MTDQMTPPPSEIPQPPPVSTRNHRLQILFIILFAILVVSVISVFLLKKNPSLETATTIPTSTPAPLMSLTKIPQDKWSTYQGTNYTLQFPSDWRADASTNAGIETMILRPIAQAKNTYVPSFAVDVYAPTSTAAAAQIEAYTQSFHFVKDSGTVASSSAERVSGIVPFQQLGGQIVKKNAYSVVYLFQAKTGTLIIRYEYDGEKVNPQYDELFEKILKTLTLTHQ